MSSCSSNNMEEDAWLMKIELKRDEPTDAVKGDKGKGATVDPSPVAAQALLAEEEEEGNLKPYLTHLSLAEIEAFRIIEIVRIQNKYLNSRKYSASRAYHPPLEHHPSIGESLDP